MEANDPGGCRAITQNLKKFLSSNVDAVDLGSRLVEKSVVKFDLLEKVRAQETSSERLSILIKAVLHNGRPGVFEHLVDCLSKEPSSEWLATELRASRQHATQSCVGESQAVALPGQSKAADELEKKVELMQDQSSLLNICGCGKCSFKQIVKCGCPSPRDDVKFPYLNMKNLTKSQKDMLINKLSQDYKTLQEKHDELFSRFRKWIQNKVTLDDYRTMLLTWKGIQSPTNAVPSFTDRKSEIEFAATHDKLSIIVSEYISWFQCDLLKRIVRFACLEQNISADEIQKYIDWYETELTAYCKRNIFECPSPSPVPIQPGTKYLRLKLDDRFECEKLHANEIRLFESKLADNLDLYPDTLILNSVHQGCVELVLCLPASIHSVTFPLDDSALKEIALLGVVEIETEGYMAVMSKEPPHFLHQVMEHQMDQAPDSGSAMFQRGTVLERAMDGKKWMDILVQPTNDLICPETHDLLIDPYLASCGHHFSKTAIEELMKMKKPCPSCIIEHVIATDDAVTENSKKNVSEFQDLKKDLNSKVVQSESQLSMSEDDACCSTSSVVESESKLSMSEDDACCSTSNVQYLDALVNNVPEKAIPDVPLKTRILALDVRCPLENRGCTWTGQLNQLEKHLGTLECQYVETKCPYNCGSEIRRGLLEKHKIMYCPKRPFTCPFCKSVKFCCEDKKIRNHMDICADRVIECPENCGERNIKLQRLKEHLYQCPNEPTNCEYNYAGCNVTMMRQSMDAHYESSIQHHSTLLVKYCDETISRIKKIQAEDRQIESMQLFRICTNHPEFKMEDYLWHKNNSEPWYSSPFYTNIPGYKMRIKFDTSKTAGYRIAVQLMQGEFDRELKFPFCGDVWIQLVDQKSENNLKEQQSNTHIMSAVAYFKFDTNTQHGYGELVDHSFIDEKQYIYCNKLVLRVIKVITMQAQIDHKDVAHDQLQEHVEHSGSKVEECSYCYVTEKFDPIMLHNSRGMVENILAPLSIEVHTIIKALKQQRQVLDKVYSLCESKPSVYQDLLEFTMSNFQHYYRNKQFFRSKPFYTHFGGYKMHLKVDGYGFGEEAGRHLSVAVVLMKGPFDDYLKFPFQGEINVQLFKECEKSEYTQSRFVFSKTIPIKITDRVSDAQHQKCYEGDNGLINDKFVLLDKVKNCSHLIFKVAKVVVVDGCSTSSDDTDTRIKFQHLYVEEKRDSYKDAFHKQLKLDKKCIQVQRQNMTAKRKLIKRFNRFNQELRLVLLIIVCIIDLVKSLSPTSADILFVFLSTAIALLITCVDMINVML